MRYVTDRHCHACEHMPSPADPDLPLFRFQQCLVLGMSTAEDLFTLFSFLCTVSQVHYVQFLRGKSEQLKNLL